MPTLLRARTALLLSVAAVAVLLLLPAARGEATPSQATLTGVPAHASLLFTLSFSSGTLARAPRAGRGRYLLTLSGLPEMGTWFSDRPARDAGRLRIRQLFAAWGPVGFAADPPNAAVVLDHGPSRRDTIAVELHLRAYDARTGTVTFLVRRLGSVGSALASLNRRLAPSLPPRFRSGALFIDNASLQGACTLGQPTLMAIPPILLRYRAVTSYLPANGALLPIDAANQALFQLYGTTFGGNGTTTFGIPNMTAPNGSATWFICGSGGNPVTPASMGGCTTGQVSYLISPGGVPVTDPDWLPADGQAVPTSQVSTYAMDYAQGQSQVTLPRLAAPPGMAAYVCVGATTWTYEPDTTQAALFPGDPNAGWGYQDVDWIEANGASLPIDPFITLYSLIGSDSASLSSFPAPSLPSPVSGLSYWFISNANWPFPY
jgi:hypothetical protein